MKRIILAVVLALAPGLSFAADKWTAVVTQELPRTDECHPRRLGAYGVAWNFATERDAQMAAKAACEKHVPFCHHEYSDTSTAPCVVLAIETLASTCNGVNFLSYNFGEGSTAAAAEEDACGHPRREGNKCDVQVNTCR